MSGPYSGDPCNRCRSQCRTCQPNCPIRLLQMVTPINTTPGPIQAQLQNMGLRQLIINPLQGDMAQQERDIIGEQLESMVRLVLTEPHSPRETLAQRQEAIIESHEENMVNQLLIVGPYQGENMAQQLRPIIRAQVHNIFLQLDTLRSLLGPPENTAQQVYDIIRAHQEIIAREVPTVHPVPGPQETARRQHNVARTQRVINSAPTVRISNMAHEELTAHLQEYRRAWARQESVNRRHEALATARRRQQQQQEVVRNDQQENVEANRIEDVIGPRNQEAHDVVGPENQEIERSDAVEPQNRESENKDEPSGSYSVNRRHEALATARRRQQQQQEVVRNDQQEPENRVSPSPPPANSPPKQLALSPVGNPQEPENRMSPPPPLANSPRDQTHESDVQDLPLRGSGPSLPDPSLAEQITFRERLAWFSVAIILMLAAITMLFSTNGSYTTWLRNKKLISHTIAIVIAFFGYLFYCVGAFYIAFVYSIKQGHMPIWIKLVLEFLIIMGAAGIAGFVKDHDSIIITALLCCIGLPLSNLVIGLENIGLTESLLGISVEGGFHASIEQKKWFGIPIIMASCILFLMVKQLCEEYRKGRMKRARARQIAALSQV